MENDIQNRERKSLLLTKVVFNKLQFAIIERFKKKYNVSGYNDSQLYGFGNYDVEKPSLKSDLELLMKGYINGKYLYNKSREIATGKPVIKISKEYKDVFLNYLGYDTIYEFLEQEKIDSESQEHQLQLLNNKSSSEDFYYVLYYYGEDSKMAKGQITIYNNWKTFDMAFVYQTAQGEPVFYNLFGSIKQENNFAHFYSKYFLDGKYVDVSKFIFYTGKSSTYERPILVGTYASFDKYDHSIAGKIIIRQVNSKQEMEEESVSRIFNPAICQELVKNRLVIPSKLPKKLSQLSEKSPYANVFSKLPNSYKAVFNINDEEVSLQFKVEEYDYNIISNTEEIELEDDRISVESKGQVLELHFGVTGFFLLQKVSMYLSVYELYKNKNKTTGQFSGIDINNNIISGRIDVFIAA